MSDRPTRVRAKICGLCRPEDARAAAESGADYLGVVFASGRRQRTPEEARAIWAGLSVPRVGVFADAAAAEVIRVAEALDLSAVQLHGDESPEECQGIRAAGPWALWKAVHVEADLEPGRLAEPYADAVDAVLLEGRGPRGRGGVGARFDWSRVGDRGAWPDRLQLILAGGLRPENVAEAIARVRPDVVDVSSGVESEVGRKDPTRIRAFLDAVRASNGEGGGR